MGWKSLFCIKGQNTQKMYCRDTPLARLGVHQSAAQRRVANISSDGGESIGCWLLWSQQPISQSKEGRLSKYCLGQTSLAATNTSTRRRKGFLNIYIFFKYDLTSKMRWHCQLSKDLIKLRHADSLRAEVFPFNTEICPHPTHYPKSFFIHWLFQNVKR